MGGESLDLVKIATDYQNCVVPGRDELLPARKNTFVPSFSLCQRGATFFLHHTFYNTHDQFYFLKRRYQLLLQKENFQRAAKWEKGTAESNSISVHFKSTRTLSSLSREQHFGIWDPRPTTFKAEIQLKSYARAPFLIASITFWIFGASIFAREFHRTHSWLIWMKNEER